MITEKLKQIDIIKFQNDLINWYQTNQRDLPWRKDQNPYKIWVSEVMLQQTQVSTVIPYFNRFMKKYPTIEDLAKAPLEDVLKMWEGLGYYSRARNLHHAANTVVERYHGQIPQDPKALGELKGVGPYTMGAILSIAFHKPEPAVDGNVMRVLSRVFKIEENIAESRTKRLFEQLVRHIISIEDPSSFNQGLMELGALICTPKSPDCTACPLQTYCQANKADMTEQLPIKSKPKKKQRHAYAVLLIKNDAGDYVIEKRGESGLLAGLWQFPMVPIDEIGFEHMEHWLYAEYGLPVKIKEQKGTTKHIFTHLIWDLAVYTATTGAIHLTDERLKLVSVDNLDTYPFPASHLKMRRFLQN